MLSLAIIFQSLHIVQGVKKSSLSNTAHTFLLCNIDQLPSFLTEITTSCKKLEVFQLYRQTSYFFSQTEHFHSQKAALQTIKPLTVS